MRLKVKWLALNAFVSCVLVQFVWSQISSKQFVIDESKPYVYLKFDHIGDRKPVSDRESSKGLWLRLVNNCGLPIKISVFDLGTGDPGVGVNFEVVPAVGRFAPDGEHQTKEPFGYNVDIGTLLTIPPKGDLLFSVPAESVTKQWSIKVRFDLDLPGPKLGGYHPYSVVDFTWSRIPEHTQSLLQCKRSGEKSSFHSSSDQFRTPDVN